MTPLRVFLGLVLCALVAAAGPAQAPPAPPTVTAMTPAPASVLAAAPATLMLSLSAAVDPATTTAATVRLFRAGQDGSLGTPDDVAVVPNSVTMLGGTQIQIDLAGIALPNDLYRVTLSGTATPPPAAIGHWALDEASGPTAADSSGGGNPGTPVNTPTVIGGKLGNALHLDGTGQIVEVPDADLFSPHVGPTGTMSISAWVRLAALPPVDRGPVVGKGIDNNWEYFLFVNANGTVSFAMVQSDGATYAEAAGGSFTTGSWHHVAGTLKKGQYVKVFLDGIQVDNRLEFAGDTLNLTAPLRIGQSGPSAVRHLDGDVDDVRLFDIELTPDQVRDLATLGGAVRDTALNVLDGEFSGSFPSGNGVPGGTFAADFSIDVPPLQVTAMAPAPGSILGAPPSNVTVTLNANVDPHTATAGTVRVFRAGPNGALGDGDDVAITPSSVFLLTPNQIRISLSGALPEDLYGVALSGTTPTVPGRVNYWKLDEGIGWAASDSAGAANGPVVGPTWVPGRVGNALHYNGISDRTLPGAAPLAAPWTASMWVLREDSPWADSRLMDSETFSGGTLRLESYNHTNRVGVAIYTVADYPSSYTAPVGQWVHLTFVGTGAQVHIYANGVLQATIATTFAVPRYLIGSHGYNTLLGTIDDVQMFDRTLTAGEIRTVATLGGAVRDLNQNRLDGEFGGAFPSGNGTAGGDYLGTFTVMTPPGAFALLSMADGTTNVQVNPTFIWNSAAGAVSYTLQVSTDAGFSSLVVDQPAIVTTAATPGVVLSYSTQYFWRVSATNAGGTTAATGAPFSFTTAAAPPAVGITVGGGCGLTGLEGLVLLALLLGWRRLRSA